MSRSILQSFAATIHSIQWHSKMATQWRLRLRGDGTVLKLLTSRGYPRANTMEESGGHRAEQITELWRVT